MMPLAIAAALLMLLVASLPAPREGRLGAGLLVLLLTVLGGAALIKEVLARTSYVSTSPTSEVLKYALGELAAASEPNVLLVDGGSYVQRGLDAKLLEHELAQLGYRTRVVRLSLTGANHFERLQLYEDLTARLPHRVNHGQRWVFMIEVQQGYDVQPLAQFEGNQDTSRAYHYLTPRNAWFALAAHHGGGSTLPLDWRGHWAVGRHAMINAFNVGLVERLTTLDEVTPARPKISNQRGRRFDFEGMSAWVAEAGRTAQASSLPPWLLPVRDRRLRAVWTPYIDEWVYFALPSTAVEQLEHARSFCLQTESPCIAPDDVALLRGLDDKQFWFDAGHLSAKGARVYTHWLAEQLAKRGVLEK
jgi:hypothetical protein